MNNTTEADNTSNFPAVTALEEALVRSEKEIEYLKDELQKVEMENENLKKMENGKWKMENKELKMINSELEKKVLQTEKDLRKEKLYSRKFKEDHDACAKSSNEHIEQLGLEDHPLTVDPKCTNDMEFPNACLTNCMTFAKGHDNTSDFIDILSNSMYNKITQNKLKFCKMFCCPNKANFHSLNWYIHNNFLVHVKRFFECRQEKLKEDLQRCLDTLDDGSYVCIYCIREYFLGNEYYAPRGHAVFLDVKGKKGFLIDPSDDYGKCTECQSSLDVMAQLSILKINDELLNNLSPATC